MALNPAEVFCEGYTGIAPSSTSSNLVKYGIMTIANLIMNKWLQSEGINRRVETDILNLISEAELDISVYFGLQKQTTEKIRSLWIEN